ncbi:hypothetical protein Tco_1012957, partial [Tanacetum coccineum]
DFLNAEIQRLSGETSTSIVPNRTNNLRMSRMAKIEFPKFYGDDPTGWVYTCNQFFKVDVVEDDHKVRKTQAISFFLGGLDKENEMSVRMFRPQTLADAYCLSKLQEANNNVSKKFTKYVHGHKCSGRLFSLEIVEDSRDYEDETEVQCNEGVIGYDDKEVEMEIGDPNDCNNESDMAPQAQISLVQSQG